MTEKTAYKTATVFFSVFTLYAVFLVATMIIKGPSAKLANPISTVNAAQVLATTDDVASRIAPAGKTKLTTDQPKLATAPVVTVAAAPAIVAGKSGEEVYNGGCGGCHGTGILNAPKKGDAAAWKPLMANGIDALVTSAINGKGAMPPKGGNAALTDAELKAAIEFML